tara:strand:+ start:266 stop:505 length:240 start_codon:yes stop_codon:yes gene_type:complete
MTDTTKYKNVSLKLETYNKLKDLSHINSDLTLSLSGTINMLVNEKHKLYVTPEVTEGRRNFLSWFNFSRSSSAGKSNDN